MMTASAWAPRRLGDVATMRSGGTPSRSVPRYFWGGIPWVSITDMTRSGKCLTSTATTLSADGLAASAATMYDDDVVLYAMYASLGEVSLPVGSMSSSQAILGIKPGRELDRAYLYYFLESIKDDVKKLGQQGTQSNLNSGMVRDIRIPVPELSEQRRIASLLSNVDDMIATLERLVAKKQAIKQGMMQELLTGRTRLPGFTDEWTAALLGDVLTVRHGRSQHSIEVQGGKYPILATGGRIGWTNTPLYAKPSILIGRKGTIDRPQFQEAPFWTVDTLFYTEVSSRADPKFLYYVFLTVDWRSMNEASGVPSLSSTRIEGVELMLPPLDEQRAIRQALNDADRELVTLGERLVKARGIKQGMMQELLTGRTRLPVEVAS